MWDQEWWITKLKFCSHLSGSNDRNDHNLCSPSPPPIYCTLGPALVGRAKWEKILDMVLVKTILKNWQWVLFSRSWLKSVICNITVILSFTIICNLGTDSEKLQSCVDENWFMQKVKRSVRSLLKWIIFGTWTVIEYIMKPLEYSCHEKC